MCVHWVGAELTKDCKKICYVIVNVLANTYTNAIFSYLPLSGLIQFSGTVENKNKADKHTCKYISFKGRKTHFRNEFSKFSGENYVPFIQSHLFLNTLFN